MLNKQQEDILKYILSLPRDSSNTVSIGNQMDTYPPDMDDDTLLQMLHTFEESSLVRLHWNTSKRYNLNIPVDITILPDGESYFKAKKKSKKTDRRDWIRTYIPITISTIALIKSFMPEITSVVKLIAQLLK